MDMEGGVEKESVVGEEGDEGAFNKNPLGPPCPPPVDQGVYYYFYQIFRSKAEAAALERRNKGIGDGSVGMFSSLAVAAMSGYWCLAWLFMPSLNLKPKRRCTGHMRYGCRLVKKYACLQISRKCARISGEVVGHTVAWRACDVMFDED